MSDKCNHSGASFVGCMWCQFDRDAAEICRLREENQRLVDTAGGLTLDLAKSQSDLLAARAENQRLREENEALQQVMYYIADAVNTWIAHFNFDESKGLPLKDVQERGDE